MKILLLLLLFVSCKPGGETETASSNKSGFAGGGKFKGRTISCYDTNAETIQRENIESAEVTAAMSGNRLSVKFKNGTCEVTRHYEVVKLSEYEISINGLNVTSNSNCSIQIVQTHGMFTTQNVFISHDDDISGINKTYSVPGIYEIELSMPAFDYTGYDCAIDLSNA